MPTLGCLVAVAVPVKLIQEPDDFLALVSPITPGGNTVCPDSSVVAPAPQGIGMDVKDPCYLPDRQHFTYVLSICHISPNILLGYPILTVAYRS